MEQYQVTLGTRMAIDDFVAVFNKELRPAMRETLTAIVAVEAIHARATGYKNGVQMCVDSIEDNIPGFKFPVELVNLLEREL